MKIIGDIGNTEIKLFIFLTNDRVLKKIVLKTNQLTDSYLSKKLFFIIRDKKNFNRALFSSVVPEAYKKIKSFFKKYININCKELKEINLDNLIKIRVNKKQVGSDRLANAIGAIDKKYNHIICDFGTATTFDVINKGVYLGGIISPGVNLSLKSLSSKASLIPNIKLLKVSNVLGKNTINAVRSGFYWGYAGLINNIIKLIMKQTKKSYRIIFTGGLAHLFKESISSRVIINKDLTINGVLKVSKNYKKK